MSLTLRLTVAAGVCASCCAAASTASARPAGDSPPARAASAVPKSVAHLLPRSGLAFDAWDPDRDRYRHSYVYPTKWQLQLNGCGSLVDGKPVGLGPGPAPFWVLQPLDGQTSSGHPVTSVTVGPDSDPAKCQRTVTLRALGRWRITTGVTDSAHVTTTATTDVTFRDLLIAAVGDSFTSGEGGKPNNGHWADAQCDRSMTPWPKLLIDLVEGLSTTVTYLNYACSGADASSIATDHYAGMRDPGPPTPKLKPQIQALQDALGDPLAPSTRGVNLLLGSFGINEMGGAKGVSAVLGVCVNKKELALLFTTGFRPFDCEQDLSGDIARLKELYDTIELAASARLKLGHMHVIGYPARVFTNSSDRFESCGVFSGMDGSETRWITDTLNGIDREVAQAALSNGWSFTATTDIFRHHGYCADLPQFNADSWFHTPVESYHRQGNRNGTIHPTKSGQRATAERVHKTVLLDEPAPPPARLRVHFLRVRVRHHGPLRQWAKELSLGLRPYESPCGARARPLFSLTLNQWRDVSADRCYDYDITTVGRTIGVSALTFLFRPSGKPPKEPRVPPGGQPAAHASRADPKFYFAVRRLHRRRDGWNATPPTGPACVLQHAEGERQSPQPGDRNPVVMEFDYEIATSGQLGPAPCAPRHLPD